MSTVSIASIPPSTRPRSSANSCSRTPRSRTSTTKQRIAYVANLGFDPLDAIPLRGEWTKDFTEVQTLDLDGQWKTVPAAKTSDGTLQLQLPLAAHRVVIFRFL